MYVKKRFQQGVGYLCFQHKFWFLPLIKGNSKIGLIQLEFQPFPEHGSLWSTFAHLLIREDSQGSLWVQLIQEAGV